MNVTNTTAAAGQNAPANRNTSKSDKVSTHIQELFAKNGISGKVELNRDANGRLSVVGDHAQKEEIETLLNEDETLSSMLADRSSSKRQSSGEQDGVTNKQSDSGVYHENSEGDSVFISDVAMKAAERQKSNHLDTIQSEDRSLEAFKRSAAFQESIKGLATTDKELELKVNYKWYSSKGSDRSTGFNASANGAMSFTNGIGMNMALRSGASMIEEGKRAVTQESDVLNSASESRKQVFNQLESAMKNAGIKLKEGQKVDFIMDEKGTVKVDPKSVNDKKLAAQIEEVINSDKNLSSSFLNHLSKSAASTTTDPASMKIHVDSVLREYTGMGFDDLEWDSDGTLVTPDGMEQAVDDYSSLGYVVGHLKSLQESEGEDIFKKEFSFSVTGSGIIDNDMSKRASSNLFDSKKMYQNNTVFGAGSNSNTINATLTSPEELVSDYWKMDALDKMFQEKGTSVYLTGDDGSSFAIDANGQRKELPYQSENYDATAKYLIEDYMIENGIKGNASDYALKINSKGSYEVVRLSDSKVK